MYAKIHNPKTNRNVSIYSPLGKKILKSYLSKSGLLGGAGPPNIPPPSSWIDDEARNRLWDLITKNTDGHVRIVNIFRMMLNNLNNSDVHTLLSALGIAHLIPDLGANPGMNIFTSGHFFGDPINMWLAFNNIDRPTAWYDNGVWNAAIHNLNVTNLEERGRHPHPDKRSILQVSLLRQKGLHDPSKALNSHDFAIGDRVFLNNESDSPMGTIVAFPQQGYIRVQLDIGIAYNTWHTNVSSLPSIAQRQRRPYGG